MNDIAQQESEYNELPDNSFLSILVYTDPGGLGETYTYYPDGGVCGGGTATVSVISAPNVCYNSIFRSPAPTRLLLMDLDETSGTSISDISGNGNNGTIGNNTAINYAVTGPKSWLPAAIQFTNDKNSGPSYIDLPTSIHPANITLSAWVYDTGASPNNPIICCDDGTYNDYSLKVKTAGSGQYLGGQIYTAGGYLQFQYSITSGEYTNKWFHLSITYDGATAKLYVDGVLKATNTSISGNIDYPGIVRTAIAYDQTQTDYWAGKTAQISIDSTALSATEIAETVAGPEPLNTVPPTLTIDGTSFSATIGTWDSQSNGTITYEWELRDSDDDSVVSSGTGSSPSGSGSYSGDYYLWVRASNNGGYDSSEDSVSNVETVSGGTSTFNEIATGGVVVGGLASLTNTFDESMTGGVVVSGSATITQSYNEIATGGVVVAGSAVISQSFNEIATGGVIVAGSAVISQSFNEIATGGVVVSGSATISYTGATSEINESMTGGVVVSGEANVNVIYKASTDMVAFYEIANSVYPSGVKTGYNYDLTSPRFDIDVDFIYTSGSFTVIALGATAPFFVLISASTMYIYSAGHGGQTITTSMVANRLYKLRFTYIKATGVLTTYDRITGKQIGSTVDASNTVAPSSSYYLYLGKYPTSGAGGQGVGKISFVEMFENSVSKYRARAENDFVDEVGGTTNLEFQDFVKVDYQASTFTGRGSRSLGGTADVTSVLNINTDVTCFYETTNDVWPSGLTTGYTCEFTDYTETDIDFIWYGSSVHFTIISFGAIEPYRLAVYFGSLIVQHRMTPYAIPVAYFNYPIVRDRLYKWTVLYDTDAGEIKLFDRITGDQIGDTIVPSSGTMATTCSSLYIARYPNVTGPQGLGKVSYVEVREDGTPAYRARATNNFVDEIGGTTNVEFIDFAKIDSPVSSYTGQGPKRLGGTAEVNQIVNVISTGGTRAGGSSDTTLSDIEDVSGGSTCGGSASVTSITYHDGSGGVSCGGSAIDELVIPTYTYDEIGSGGCVASGGAAAAAWLSEIMSGGALAGGYAVASSSLPYTHYVTFSVGPQPSHLFNFPLYVNVDLPNIIDDEIFRVTDNADNVLQYEIRKVSLATKEVIFTVGADIAVSGFEGKLFYKGT